LNTTRARLFHHVRTVHLERAAKLPPAVILYGRQRYDFDAELAAGLDLVQARSWRAAWWLVRHPVQTLEINEPLMLPAVRSTAPALLGLTVGRLLGRGRTRVVSYAMENLDAETIPSGELTLRRRLGRQLDRWLVRFIWRRTDRIVFATSTAAELYAQRLPAKDPRDQTLIWALPAPAAEAAAAIKDPGQVLFVGAFTERKGFPLLVRAWPLVRRALPDARLQLVGKGPLQPLAEELAARDRSVTCTVDPPRAAIREVQARSQVLVLASQRSPTWREQVGLPIVEGLSFGCTIVTTTETGLADWLVEHGHRVISPDGDEAELAAAIVSALQSPATGVLESLPEEDGRLAADAWMFR
jgi:glycosyltransferase involved in cell wall biosynthesis